MFFLLSLTCLLAPWDQSAIFCSNNFNGKASKLIPDETFRHGRVFNLRQKVSCRSRSWTNLPFSWYFYGASQDVFICIKLIEILLDTEKKLFLLRLLQTFNLELQLLQILIEFCLFLHSQNESLRVIRMNLVALQSSASNKKNFVAQLAFAWTRLKNLFSTFKYI